MLFSLLTLAASAISVQALANPPVGEKFAGAYVLFGDPQKLALIAQNAATLPVNRVWLSFARPDMYYEPGSNTLVGVGLNYNNTQADYGFAEIKKYTAQLQAGGVEVFLSMGGWDYNCWPWAYAQYSIFNYGSTTPTFQSTIGTYAGGDIAKCNAGNQFCYACEPPSNGNTPDSYAVFPEPDFSATWKQAQDYVTTNNKMGEAPVWHPELVAGYVYNTPKNGQVAVPGLNTWYTKKRDPYQDLVLLAKDLGLDGIDIDYEEFWHADMFKADASAQQNCGNGCTLYQTVFKYAAILQDVRLNIQQNYPTLKLSTAASAAGAWAGTWWGGNLKGITLNMVPSYPDLVQYLATGANAGGWNVMSYDLSASTVNCPPAPATCTLDGQVNFYMGQYASAGVPANVGYEIGTPAYPPPSDAKNQVPLTNVAAGEILSNTQPFYKGGFFWELFKPQGTNADAHVNILAQSLCKAVLGANTPRCSGSVPVLNDAILPGSNPTITTHAPVGPTPAGPPPCAAPWDATVRYSTGMQFSYNGYNWNTAYYAGEPGTKPPAPGFAQLGLCVPGTAATTTAVAGQTSVTVAPGQTTTTAGSAGQTPCVAPYDATKTYQKGDQASEGGANYVANWYSLNSSPSANSAPYSQWTKLGACGGNGQATTTVAVPVTTTAAVKVTTTAVVPVTTTAAVQVTTTAAVQVTTTAAVVKTTTAVVVPKTTTAAVVPTTAAAVTTSAASGNKIVVGQPCTTNGQWACSNTVICAYGASSTLVWVSQGGQGC
ncbi:hypothetical protein HDU79_011408 [Rhizoclosmatium sp. JEL0117]|nr:hypothetical protein HDU79_011408 [Rhizoclosmatium sp. JEL0117]